MQVKTKLYFPNLCVKLNTYLFINLYLTIIIKQILVALLLLIIIIISRSIDIIIIILLHFYYIITLHFFIIKLNIKFLLIIITIMIKKI